MRHFTFPLLLAFALVAAACSAGDASDASPTTTDVGSTTSTVAVADIDADLGDETDQPPDIFAAHEAAAAELAEPENDRDLPPDAPAEPIGAYGYSRYVFARSGDQVIPSLIEGPLGYQVRCQQEAQECSYRELKALYESGIEPPSYLGMDRVTLGELVDQLDRVNVAISQYDDIGDACAAGFWKSTNQVANMGIHMIDRGASGFDPDRPQMVLFAKDGGIGLGSGEIGNCNGGEWTGDDGFVPVGAVFNLALTDDHPEGFAGPIDNWHIHYNTCIGRADEAGSSLVNDSDSTASAEGGRSSTTSEACSERGGTFLPVISNWMMHAYVADGFDAQSGVFAMFNPTVWPLSDVDELAAERVIDPGADVVAAPIINFSFGEVRIGLGETVRFANSDAVPHTVTAGTFIDPTGTFDSGVIGTGQAYDLSFDEPGEFALFCVLHPEMTATVVVE